MAPTYQENATFFKENCKEFSEESPMEMKARLESDLQD